MVGLISSYNRLAADLSATMKRVSSQPQIEREVEYYRANIGNVKSVDEFMGNTRVYNFALKAFGLEDMQYAKAFIRKVLNEGVDDSEAFSMQLSDQRFREFATAFNFKRYGSATTAFDRVQEGAVSMYLRNSLEAQSGEESEALRLALYFERKASTVTTAFGILADKAMYQVVRTAFGLPDALSSADIDRQARILSDKIDVEELQDPAYVKKMITRFLARYEADNGSSEPSPATTILAGSNSGIDMRMILSLQTLKKYGA